MYSTVLLKLLILSGLTALLNIQQPPIQEELALHMTEDFSGLPETINEEVSIHKVWKLKYTNKLHPSFSGMYTFSTKGEWNLVDFTNPDSVRITPKDGEQYSVPYRIDDDELVFPLEGKLKKIKKNETRISTHISLLTTHHLGITHYIHAGKNKKDMEGKFIEWVFEEVR